jgi:hypothetical protein
LRGVPLQRAASPLTEELRPFAYLDRVDVGGVRALGPVKRGMDCHIGRQTAQSACRGQHRLMGLRGWAPTWPGCPQTSIGPQCSRVGGQGVSRGLLPARHARLISAMCWVPHIRTELKPVWLMAHILGASHEGKVPQLPYRCPPGPCRPTRATTSLLLTRY